MLHHVSRHLSDRPKRVAVAYNALELRAMGQVQVGKSTLALRLEGGPVLARAFVDYASMYVGEATLRRQASPHAALYGRASTVVYVVDQSIYDRGDQQGGRLELGVSLTGRGGALELFGGYEQVVDGYQLELVPKSWAFAGFRLVK